VTNFTTRIELHDADAEDYAKLHEAMEAAGFSRTITSSDGTRYELPNAEYNFSHTTMTADQVRDKAAAAAIAVKRNPAVLVTSNSGARSWHGLKKA
jgi:hypothetical protein